MDYAIFALLLAFGFTVDVIQGQSCADTDKLCGCFNQRCWKYSDGAMQVGSRWCYTQRVGVETPRRAFAECAVDANCFLQMTCGSSTRYTGSQPRAYEDNQPEIPDPSMQGIGLSIYGIPLWSPYQARTCAETSRECGCHEGRCWSYSTNGHNSGDPWCYTQVLGEPQPRRRFAHCASDSECYQKMTCGSGIRYSGSQTMAHEDTLPEITVDSGHRPSAVAPSVSINGVQLGGWQGGLGCSDVHSNSPECGCFQQRCWSYASWSARNPGDPWCFTQQLGEEKPLRHFASCTDNADCYTGMTCGSSTRYRGESQPRSYEDTLPPVGEVVSSVPLHALGAVGVLGNALRCDNTQRDCGCINGGCWAYSGTTNAGDPWCYTQVLGEASPRRNFATCSRDSDCYMSMTCGSSSRYTGNNMARSYEDTLGAIPAGSGFVDNNPTYGQSLPTGGYNYNRGIGANQPDPPQRTERTRPPRPPRNRYN